MTPSRTRRKASGRFVLRIDPALHEALRRAAADRGLSLNDYCSRRLGRPDSEASAALGTTQVVERARSLFETSLVGVLVHGSWARGEAGAGSDVDLLVVVEQGVPLGREVYRRWDLPGALEVDGRPVEVHVVHAPETGAPVTALWAEIALDGIVLFERDRAVTTHLARVRREIAAGRLVRRVVHGQPYWTEIA